MATKGHGLFGHAFPSRRSHWYRIVNMYVNAGEENAVKKRGLWSSWSFGHAGKVAPDMESPILVCIHIYIFFKS